MRTFATLDDKKIAIIDRISAMEGDESKEALKRLVVLFVSDNAGNLQNPFAYLSKSSWDSWVSSVL